MSIMKYDHSPRISFLVYASVLFAAILIARLFEIQIVRGSDYSEMAARQYSRPMPDIFSRGTIYFTEKNGNLVSAATLQTNFVLAVNPEAIKDAGATFKSLSPFVDFSEEEFLKRASKEDDTYEVVGKIKGEDEFEKINELKLAGVFTFREKSRFYPAGRLASHVLGIVSRSKEEGERYIGRYGAEKQYEDLLHRDSESVYVNFFAEIFSNVKKTILGDGNNLSGDVALSIEPTVEGVLEKELVNIQEAWKGKSSAGIIMEPKTGKIVAMAALPDFDPNYFGKEKSVSVFRNPLVEDVFEMGSTIKPLTVASGLDAGVIAADSTYYDTGSITLNSKTISNFDGRARGTTNMQDALGNSLNLGMINIMQKLGKERFRNYMLGFGIGEKTGVDLPNEVSGLVKNLNSKYEVDYATASFGQGIAMSPIEAATALSSLGNGGILVKPSVVNKVKYRIGLDSSTEEEESSKRILKEKTSEEISRMLVKVVDENLLGGTYKLKNYSVAAKTGTALLVNGSGGYYNDRFIHTFFGYFPAYNPKYLVFLYTVDPQGVEYASHSLTEPFFNIAKFLIGYYEIPPDR
ncbi:MAG TPA: penicillin-binding protein 2 [Candidatus Paceibacterota bacterium]|nr:penicillin-binding protein 2 [Candidatus Paceibacterota bacterium]